MNDRETMSRKRTIVAAVSATATMAGMMIAGGSGAAMASPAPTVTQLPGSAVPFTSHASATGAVAGSQQLSIQVWLRGQTAAAQNFATAVSTPGSPQFHHYLSPDSYTARFGPTRAEASKVEAWLRAQGFTGITVDSQRSYVRATATTTKINKAFATTLKLYKSSAKVNAGKFQLRANNKAISVPSSLAGSVVGVTGMDNAAPTVPLEGPDGKTPSTPKAAKVSSKACSHYYGQHITRGLPRHFGVTAFPTEPCGYTARQVRVAYGANMHNTGRGQTIALVELGLTPEMFRTLRDYAKAVRMPSPVKSRYHELSLGQGSACGDFFDVEEQLDVESSFDMAPGAHQLVVGGDSCNNGDFGLQGLFNADTAVLGGNGHHPRASIASNSWESGDESQPASLTNIEHAFLLRAAAEGVGMYFSAGDASGAESPSTDPFAVSVGGTTLGIGKTDNRLFETGWSTGESFRSGKRLKWIFCCEQGASGGGASLLWKEPAYQKRVVPAALAKGPGNRGPSRVAPDISADADPFTGFAVGLLSFDPPAAPSFFLSDIGGTSLAAPLVAGIVAAAQQGQHKAFGLINPAIYKLAGTSAIHDALPLTSHTPALFRGMVCDTATCGQQLLTTFDDQSPNMLGYTGQVALKGYDDMTGVGTPAGQKFITALRRLEK